jgi:hypothetical protein
MEAVQRRLLHRHLDRLPLAGLAAREERRENAGDADDGGTVVRGVAGQPAGRTVGEPRGMERAGGGERGQRLGAPRGARPGEAEVGEREVDETGMAAAHLGGREPVPALLVRPEVLDQDVGVLAEPAEAPPAVGRVQVDDGAAFVGVAIEEGQRTVGGREPAGEGRAQAVGITARRLHLDHVGAEIGEQAPRERAAQVRQLDDTEVGERRGHGEA